MSMESTEIIQWDKDTIISNWYPRLIFIIRSKPNNRQFVIIIEWVSFQQPISNINHSPITLVRGVGAGHEKRATTSHDMSFGNMLGLIILAKLAFDMSLPPPYIFFSLAEWNTSY